MNLKQMIQRQQELLDSAKAANRKFTAEEQAEYDDLQRQIDAAKASAEQPKGLKMDDGRRKK